VATSNSDTGWPDYASIRPTYDQHNQSTIAAMSKAKSNGYSWISLMPFITPFYPIRAEWEFFNARNLLIRDRVGFLHYRHKTAYKDFALGMVGFARDNAVITDTGKMTIGWLSYDNILSLGYGFIYPMPIHSEYKAVLDLGIMRLDYAGHNKEYNNKTYMAALRCIANIRNDLMRKMSLVFPADLFIANDISDNDLLFGKGLDMAQSQ
jgi:hypothetical protein